MKPVKSDVTESACEPLVGRMMNPQFASISLPSFDGLSSVKRFLDDFDRFSRLQGWDSDKKLDVFPLCLKGIARDAFDSLRDDQKVNFAGVSAGLRVSFSSRSSVDHHVALRHLKFDPSGSLDAFVIEFKKLVAHAFPGQQSEGLLYNNFLSSLPDDLCAAIIGDGIGTFDGAVTKVRNMCSAAKRYNVGAPTEPVRQVAATVEDSLVARLERRIAELEAKVEARGSPSRQSSGCFACGDSGHFRVRCEHRNAVCTKCGRRGHLALVCGRYPGNYQGSPRGATGGPDLTQRP